MQKEKRQKTGIVLKDRRQISCHEKEMGRQGLIELREFTSVTDIGD